MRGKAPPRTLLAAVALSALLALAPTQSRAADLTVSDYGPSLETHGFVSQGYIKSSANNFLSNSASQSGSFEFTEIGLNFTSQLADRLRMGVQLFARDLGPVGNYSAKMDWFYLDYRWRDWLGLRAGRVKLPFGLYNDVSDIDAARVPILLPQSVYPLANRDFLLAQTGMELYGYLSLRRAGALDYHLYTGTIHIDLPSQVGAPVQVTQLRNPYIVGGRLLWETPLEGLRLGGSVQALRLDLSLFTPMTNAMSWYRLPAVLWLGSVEYAVRALLLSAEYGRWYVSSESSDPNLVRPSYVSEQGYVMASYRATARVQPGAYYSILFPDVRFRTRSRADMQHDVAATLRFDINSHWLVKVEGHYMHGTAALQSAQNGNAPLGNLTKDWVVGLVKTTAYF